MYTIHARGNERKKKKKRKKKGGKKKLEGLKKSEFRQKSEKRHPCTCHVGSCAAWMSSPTGQSSVCFSFFYTSINHSIHPSTCIHSSIHLSILPSIHPTHVDLPHAMLVLVQPEWAVNWAAYSAFLICLHIYHLIYPFIHLSIHLSFPPSYSPGPAKYHVGSYAAWMSSQAGQPQCVSQFPTHPCITKSIHPCIHPFINPS